MLPKIPLTYLVEGFHPHLDYVLFSDVTNSLALAIESSWKYLQDYTEQLITVRVDHERIEDGGGLEGVRFVDELGALRALITVYRLERETAECLHPGILAAVEQDHHFLERNLRSIFR